jgi:NDP-sugar pyrophosphorylase family protein
MRAMILAAGHGTRLHPLTDTIPKPLLPVAGKPLIVWNLLLLRKHGITEVCINLHYLGHLIQEELGDGSQFGMRIRYSREPIILGTGGGIKQAEPFFGGEPFLVINGDTLVDLDLTGMMASHRERTGLATLALRDDPEVERWGVVETDAMARVLTINGRGMPDEERGRKPAQRRMFAGIHVMDPFVLRDVPVNRETSIIDAYVTLLQRSGEIYGYSVTGYWSDVGTPERYVEALRDADAGRINLRARLSPS